MAKKPASTKVEDDEYVIDTHTGKPVKVADLSEEQAKEIVRMIVREHRQVAEFVGMMFGGKGPKSLFGEGLNDEVNLASIHAGTKTKQ